MKPFSVFTDNASYFYSGDGTPVTTAGIPLGAKYLNGTGGVWSTLTVAGWVTDPESALVLAAGSSITTAGAFGITFTTTATTAVTLPTSGTLATLAGTETLSGKTLATLTGSTQALTTAAGVGAVNVTTATTKLTSTGNTDALSLADGADGQIKTIVMVADGGDATLTPTTKTGFTTIVFDAVGDSVVLQFFTTLGWMVLSNNGATIS